MNLTEWRAARGLSMRAAAVSAHVSLRTWFAAEHGQEILSSNFLRIVIATGLPLWDLVPLVYDRSKLVKRLRDAA